MNMAELKTLKDLRNTPLISTYPTDYILIESELKHEVINWIKVLKNNKEFVLKGDERIINIWKPQTRFLICEALEINIHEAIIDWFKHFFNITNEDLK